MEERKSKTLERRLRGLECENYRELRYLLDKGLELPGDLKYCVSCNAPENCLRYKPKGVMKISYVMGMMVEWRQTIATLALFILMGLAWIKR